MLSTRALIDFLVEHCGLSEEELAPDTSLFQEGLLDSFSMVDLIEFIERSADIRLKPTEVSLNNLDTMERIRRFVESKVGT